MRMLSALLLSTLPLAALAEEGSTDPTYKLGAGDTITIENKKRKLVNKKRTI